MKKTIALLLVAASLAWAPVTVVSAQSVPDYSGWTQEQRDAKLLELLTLVVSLLQQLMVLQQQAAATTTPVVVIVQPSQPSGGVGASVPADPVDEPTPVQTLNVGQFGPYSVAGGGCAAISFPFSFSDNATGTVMVNASEAQKLLQAPGIFTYEPKGQNRIDHITFSASSTESVVVDLQIGLSLFNQLLADGYTVEEATTKMQNSDTRFDPATGACI